MHFHVFSHVLIFSFCHFLFSLDFLFSHASFLSLGFFEVMHEHSHYRGKLVARQCDSLLSIRIVLPVAFGSDKTVYHRSVSARARAILECSSPILGARCVDMIV